MHKPLILIFTEGTIIMHKSAAGHTRREIVKQVIEENTYVHRFWSYISIGDAADKLRSWKEDGARIAYLTSRRKPEEIRSIRSVLKRNGFPQGRLLHRRRDEEYNNVAERVIPDILIEDDCESAGGKDQEQMTITNVRPDLKKRSSI